MFLWAGQAWATALSPSEIVRLTNVDRERSGIEMLSMNDTLTRAAELKVGDMAKGGYFAHVSPEGKSPWYWFEQAGYSYRYAGENLAIRFTNAEEEQSAWMNSASHRANILNPNYHEIGVAVKSTMENGQPVMIVAQLFGTRMGQVLPASSGKGNLEKGNQSDVAVPSSIPEKSVIPVMIEQSRSVPDRESYSEWNILNRVQSYGIEPISLGLIGLIGFLEIVSVIVVSHIARRSIHHSARV